MSDAIANLRTRRPWRERGVLIALGAVHGVLMALALAPVGLWPLALIALVPVFVACERLSCAGARPARGAAWFALGTLPYWLYLHAFLIDVTAPGYPGLGVLLSSYTWLSVWIAARAWRLVLRVGFALAAIAWTGGEFFRGEIAWDGYPWALAAHPLVEWFAIAAPAAVGGQYLLVLLVALFAASLVATRDGSGQAGSTRTSGRVGTGLTLGAWFVLSVVGHRMVPASGGDELPVAVVQTNVPQSNKMSWRIQDEIDEWRRLENATLRAATAGPGVVPDLIIWPETMMPGPTLEPEALEVLAREGMQWNLPVNPVDASAPTSLRMTAFADRLLEMQNQLTIPMLVGEEALVGLEVVKGDATGSRVSLKIASRFNSVFLIDGARISRTRYDKIRLTPFGEVMPYISAWPWLEARLLALGAAGMRFDLRAGTEPTVFAVGSASLGRDVRVVTPICFEATTSWVCRRMIFADGARRADLIVNVSNDGWFGWWDAGRVQHMQQARMRCIELATPMVRAANTGVSAIVNARGQVLEQGAIAEDGTRGTVRVGGVLWGRVPLAAGSPLYAVVGDAVGCAAMMVAVIIAAILPVFSFVRRSMPPAGSAVSSLAARPGDGR
jgi:apolipoprotein N-acyltransferase